jgi:predicted amidohydrolase YtcJ
MKTIYKNGLIITGQTPEPSAMVTENDRIIYIGPESEATTLHPDSTSVDLEGRKVLPGFIDGYVHSYIHTT